jgi:hypothetical protein
MRKVFAWLGLSCAVALLAWCVRWQHNRALRADTQLELRLAKLDSAVSTLTRARRRSDTVYLSTVEHFHTTHDSLVREVTSGAGDSLSRSATLDVVHRMNESCNLVISACEARARVTDVLIDSLKEQDALLRSAHAPSPPRLTTYADVLYEPWTRAEMARVGASFHILGSISAIGEAEGTHAPRHPNAISERIAIGVRYTFQ